MTCYLCGGKIFRVLFDYAEPDKYERWMGLENVSRQWGKCLECGLVQSFRNYPLEKLEAIYRNGYRHPAFRGETIGETFQKIMAIPMSENSQRCEWLNEKTELGKVLDIGSGLGVFPVVMEGMGYTVDCVEENCDSIQFLTGMGFDCYSKAPNKRYDIVSLIHVLEHIEDPIPFLRGLKSNFGKWLFIEVPDAKEFEYLPKDHDEFNSCHVKFYSRETLTDLLKRSGYRVSYMDTQHYADRNLSRILTLCE